MSFRVGYYGDVLQLDDQDIMFSQLGGYMCQAPKTKLDLHCQICNKPLEHIFQFVSSKSDILVHKVVYVLLCDSDHYHESVKVLVWRGQLPTQEAKDEQQKIETTSNVEEIDLLTLVSDLSSAHLVDQYKIKEHNPRIYSQKRKSRLCPAYDIYTEEAEDFLENLTEKAGNLIDNFNQIYKNAIYVVSDTTLCEQTCKQKMKKGEFSQVAWVDLEYSDSDENQIMPNIEINLDPCQCQYCVKFNENYQHEFDLFSGAIWPLKLQYAEFKALFIFSNANTQLGWAEGVCLILKDEDDVQQLKLHKK
ncbi:hypothetical protein SS50377_22193 [Spironucleus salmonicida]|uniref:Uncharacterized protein n=1 Tax=Spironucleus salmonicida TaxID=348837 RepID=V6LLQ2_9EUKA|nr:hypothetical protein SS50377_22193 [Spironucleus salmonicida]|eukprot:EST45645.1 hypothetical protein SS50377_14217 [Spironucleus salmonicida]